MSPWPKLAGNTANSSYSPAKSVLRNSKWVFQTDGPVISSPALGTDGTVYVAADTGIICALDSTSGKPKWCRSVVPPKWLQWFKRQKTADFSCAVSSPALGANGLIYVGFKDGNIYAVDIADGSIEWTFKAQGKFARDGSPGSPTIGTNGSIYFTSGDTLFALEGTNGRLRWSTAFRGNTMNAPAIGPDGTIYLATLEGLFAIDPMNGVKRWEFFGSSRRNDFNCSSSPTIGNDGTLYVGDYKGSVYAVDRLTGKKKWQHKLSPINGHPDNVEMLPAIGRNGIVYVATQGDRIIALNSQTGEEKWNNPGIDGYLAVGADGTVYANLIDNCSTLVAYDGRTGKTKSSLALDKGVKATSTAPFAIGKDGTIYVGTWSGKVHAIHY